MYRIVQVGRWWVVCAGQAMQLAFDTEEAAIKTVKDAERLMAARSTPAPVMRQPVSVREPDPRYGGSSLVPRIPVPFVERRGIPRPVAEDRRSVIDFKTA